MDGHRAMSAVHHQPAPLAFQPPSGPEHPHPHHPYEDYSSHPPQSPYTSVNFMRGPKRKRLAKACDSCHRSKRRCDGTEPCGNCQWANKQCSYTDQSGRRVPPPNSNTNKSVYGAEDGASRADNYSTPSPSVSRYPPDIPPPAHSYSPQHGEPAYPPGPSQPNVPEYDSGRKRYRAESGSAIAGPAPIPTASISIDAPTLQLDHTLVHELTSLFFANCHLARAIIHKPVFSTALTQNRVPKHLLFAMCAVAAPFSKQEKVKTNPPRLAGRPFAQEALSLLFDGAGRLIQERSLATAQTLCLMQIYEMMASEVPPSPDERYHSLALQVIDHLGVMYPDHARLTPVPDPSYVDMQMQRECLRRIFWFIHFMDLLGSVFYRRPSSISSTDPRLQLRLPLSETCFELAVTNILPEFLSLAPVKAPYSSEFGHLIRVMTIYSKIEKAVSEPDEKQRAEELTHCSELLKNWNICLSEGLEYKQERIEVQKSMLMTSSSTGAWCYFHIHIVHASCELALNEFRRTSSSHSREAGNKICNIIELLGEQAKHTLIPASAAWALLRYRRDDSDVVRAMCRDVSDYFGIDVRKNASFPHPAPPSSSSSPIAGPSSLNSVFLGDSRRSRRPDAEYTSDTASMSSRGDSTSPALRSTQVNGGCSSNEDLRLPQVEGPSNRHQDGEALVDPALMTEDGRTSRNHLPSLKLSGLLHTFPRNTSGSAVNGTDPGAAPRSTRSPPTPPPGLRTGSSSEKHPGAPVGLPWLRKDSLS